MITENKESTSKLTIMRKGLKDIFIISLIAYLVFFLIEIPTPGIISNYFNHHILLLIIFVSGLFSISIKETASNESGQRLKIKQVIFLVIVVVLSLGIALFELRGLGRPGYLFVLFFGGLMLVISYLILKEE